MTGISCPDCKKRGFVIDSRPAEYGVRRRWGCGNGHRFTSIEIVAVRDTTKTVHVSRAGAVAVAVDGVAALRSKAMRAVEMAIR